ncbi:cytochrome P450 [Lentzea sp. NPDC051838]|uniref:cytochrome P450 n=1 Tax=Lentzea sp. NPDC051838 TaxID=3154849 RepID=UPI00341E2013
MDLLERLAEPAHIDDPFPYLAWLRENDPLSLAADGKYYACRHADVVRVLSADGFRNPEVPPGEPASDYQRMLRGGMTFKNPPEHARLRGPVSRAFTARRVDGLRPAMARITDRLLDVVDEPLRDGGTVDLHGALSVLLPMEVTAELIGVPPEDRDEVAALVRTIVPVLSSATASEQHQAAADDASGLLQTYFQRLIASRAGSPRDDLVSALVTAEDRLTEEELISTLATLWIAGFETTASVIDHGVLAMTRYPDELRWLRGGHGEAMMFAEEVLRQQSVVLFAAIPRIATHEVELSGGLVPKGAVVRVMPAAANRDPAAFAEPDLFLPGRFESPESPMLSLGHGMHLCVGARLARTEVAVALGKLHARFPGLVLADPPVRSRSVGLRVIEQLPVRLG